MATEVLYHTLTGRIIGSLYEQLLFVGIFAVSLGIVRRSILDEGWFRSFDLLRHLMLLGSVALFTLYMGLSYEIENYKGLQFAITGDKASHVTTLLLQLPEAAQRTAIAQLIMMLPVDLIGVILNSSLFAILAFFSLDQRNWTGRNLSTTRIVMFLLAVMALWHLMSITWWLLYAFFESGFKGFGSYLDDILFHIYYIIIEITSYIAIRYAIHSRIVDYYSWITSTCAVLIFVSILISLYAIRLWEYSGRFFSMLTN